MEQEPQTALERALLLLRASLVPGWQPTVEQGLVWAIRCAVGLGVLAFSSLLQLKDSMGLAGSLKRLV